MPNIAPVRIFARPENTRVVGRDIDLVNVKAIIKGRSVPRSPKDPIRRVMNQAMSRMRLLVSNLPDSSASRELRRVRKLC